MVAVPNVTEGKRITEVKRTSGKEVLRVFSGVFGRPVQPFHRYRLYRLHVLCVSGLRTLFYSI